MSNKGRRMDVLCPRPPEHRLAAQTKANQGQSARDNTPRISKKTLKRVLGELPLTAELYWQLRQQGKPISKSFSLHRTQKQLPAWIAQASSAKSAAVYRSAAQEPKHILFFATLRYWIEHATLLSLAMAGLGHEVMLAYLPYNNWRSHINRFDLRRQNLYARNVLQLCDKQHHTGDGLIQPISFFDVLASGNDVRATTLPVEIENAIEAVSIRDTQYTLQVEDIDKNSGLYQLRLERNTQAACAAWIWLRAHRPDVLVTPNGSILEMGVIYQVARYLDIPVVTYEFGEQRGRIWLAHNDEVMLQHTDDLWAGWKDYPLSEIQIEKIRDLYASRQQASLWENFSRRWQGQPSQGGNQARQAIGLDKRPIALLAANVIGDSLTLGRQVFSKDMTEWLQRTIRNFAQRPETQLVVRIHPGERYTKGPSVADVVSSVLPELPENIHLVPASDPINTYDLIEIADLGLVYTTTVGMEMAMAGVPVAVVGQTHYRGKGFTLDPVDWEDYFELLNSALHCHNTLDAPEKKRLSRQQVDLAWQYAYRFFFSYPLPFPWHLLHFWNELDEWPMDRVLSPEGQALYGQSFAYLTGEPRSWDTENEQ